MCKKNRAKEYYLNNKVSILEHLKNKIQSLTEDKKQKLRIIKKNIKKNIKKI